jgi:putative transposase
MQYVGRRYVPYINDTYRRSGTLWEGRYKSSVV